MLDQREYSRHFGPMTACRHMGCVTQKGAKSPESLSYQKKDGWVTRPSFFWYDTDLKKKIWEKKIIKKFFGKKKIK